MMKPLRPARLLLLITAIALAGCQTTPAVLRVVKAAPTTLARADAPIPVLTHQPLASQMGPATSQAQAPAVIADQLVAGLKPGIAPETFMQNPSLAGFSLRSSFKLGGRYVLKLALPAGVNLMEGRSRLAETGLLQRVSENARVKPLDFAFSSKDTRFDEQWAHLATHANTTNAWTAVTPAAQSKVIVAILDTGCDVTHPEFAGRIVNPTNYTLGNNQTDTNVTDDVGHGTHVTGIIGAAGNNGIGVAGVAWGVKLMPCKVLGGNATGFEVVKALLDAVHFAPQDGSRVRVINMSLGTVSGGVDAYFTEAIAEARAAGVLVVAAAGNDGSETVGSPANTPSCIAVGSTGHYLDWEVLSSFSNHGDRIDLSAPGEDILSTLPGNGSGVAQYGYESGTSMASPYVAGVAALVAAKYDGSNQSMTAAFADKIKARLLAAVDDLGVPGWDPLYGAGRLNAGKAVTPATIDAAP